MFLLSPPVRGAWVEILLMMKYMASGMSPPVRGAWVEIGNGMGHPLSQVVSPPVRGAWVEISAAALSSAAYPVAPCAGGVG